MSWTSKFAHLNLLVHDINIFGTTGDLNENKVLKTFISYPLHYIDILAKLIKVACVVKIKLFLMDWFYINLIILIK